MQLLHQHVFPNGLTLLFERMDHVRSASLYFMAPSGFTYEPADRLGLAGILAEMLTRGAGTRDTKALSLALDNLGVDRGESCGAFNITLSAGTLARNLPAALALYADVIRRPWLPDDELEPAQELALQDLQGLDDSPSEICLLELRNRYFPPPYNRNQYGTRAGIESIHPSQEAAARSLGLTRIQALRFVVLPQAVRRVIPPLLNDFIGLQKDTVLVSFIGVVDLFRTAQIKQAATFNFTPYLAVALVFVVVTFPLARIVDWLVARDRARASAGAR